MDLIKIVDEALKEHYRETMGEKRVPSDYLCMFTEGGESHAVASAVMQETLKMVITVLKKYRISITNEGILIPYNDEWDYLYDCPRSVLLRGNDKSKSAVDLYNQIT
ncbi:hypothetical protein LCGC14_0767690 [marine sediment metagenome]|uniref:Uncharacterized protein n=1 Tax=marine sediment metagenome TaxID=412755 RepID=A0A0F9Q3D6_9ZZZZ